MRKDLIEKLVGINRVATVVKGGRRFSFAAIVIVGDGKGMVGYGTGKAREVPDAIRKATEQAKLAMVRVPMSNGCLRHDISGRYSASEAILRVAPPGTGIIAGGPMRAIFEAAGLRDVVAKAIGSTNPHNLIKATFEAFYQSISPRSTATKRGCTVATLSLPKGNPMRLP